MNTRMWIEQYDKLGPTGKKFFVDNPVNIPRKDEFIDGDTAAGVVTHVQYFYKTIDSNIDDTKEFGLIINVIVK